MELYHLHLKGIKDDKWRVGKEFVIDSKFTNRIGKKVNSFNDCTVNPRLDKISCNINEVLNMMKFNSMDKMPIYMILEYMMMNDLDSKTKKAILKEARNLAFDASIFKREMAMENFRRDNNYKHPSRQHCIYATDYEGIDYWQNNLIDGSLDIFRIESIEEPFKTNEIFIPSESLSYEEIYKNSYRYWNPKFKNISATENMKNEYLVQGKIKVLEKVGEIKK